MWITLMLAGTGYMLLLLLVLIEPNRSSRRVKRIDAVSKMKELQVKRLVEDKLNKKVKFHKRDEIETLCLQAGFAMTYGEYVMLSTASALALGCLVAYLLKNTYLLFIFGGLGYVLPKQFFAVKKNRRVEMIDKQTGSFLTMVVKRYEAVNNFSKALELTAEEFSGIEPMYTELRKTVADVQNATLPEDAMDSLAKRTGNKYIRILGNYYRVTASIGTADTRKILLDQAIQQYEENSINKAKLKKELSAPVREAYMLLAVTPALVVFQTFTNPDYLDFMRLTTLGRIGTSFVSAAVIGTLWFINFKVGAPIE